MVFKPKYYVHTNYPLLHIDFSSRRSSISSECGIASNLFHCLHSMFFWLYRIILLIIGNFFIKNGSASISENK